MAIRAGLYGGGDTKESKGPPRFDGVPGASKPSTIVISLATMVRLVVAALLLASIAGLGGCGAKPLKAPVGGHAGAGADAAAGAGAPDAAIEHVDNVVPEPAPDASPVDHADAPAVEDVPLDRATMADGPAIDLRDGGADAPVDVAKDATLSDAKRWDALPKTWLAFDVTATVTVKPPSADAKAWTSFPTTFRFSMGWLPLSARILINGGTTAPISSLNDTIFETAEALFLDVPFPPGCNTGSILVDQLRFFLGSDGLLGGSGSGSATFWMNEAVFQAPVTFTLSGGPDVTPPTLTPVGGVIDPLTPLFISSSEGLAPKTAITLVGTTSGDRIPLMPQPLDDVFGQAVASFVAPNAVLRWGEVYKLETAGAVDLAGNALAFTTPATETTPAPPPLQKEDGFEMVGGTAYGGAGVLKGGPLVIRGTTSLVVGNGVGFPTFKAGTSMALRLTVAPGDTVVRLAARLVTVAGATEAAFRGVLMVGVVGGTTAALSDVLSDDVQQVSLGAAGNATVSAVQTVEIALPGGASNEVSFEIMAEPNVCGTPPDPSLLVIDDLRVE